MTTRPTYEAGSSKEVVKKLHNRKQLYDPKTCLFTTTINYTSEHETPFLVHLPELSEEITAKYPKISGGDLNGLFYVPANPILVDDLCIECPELNVSEFQELPKYKLLLQALLEVSDFIKWRSDSYVDAGTFDFNASEEITDLCKYILFHKCIKRLPLCHFNEAMDLSAHFKGLTGLSKLVL